MKALVAALERIATALEQLVPAVQQATREASQKRALARGAAEYANEDAAIAEQTLRVAETWETTEPCAACGNTTTEPMCGWCA